jgi:hypothetical protein
MRAGFAQVSSPFAGRKRKNYGVPMKIDELFLKA